MDLLTLCITKKGKIMKRKVTKFRCFAVLSILFLLVTAGCSQNKEDKVFKESFSKLLESEVMGNDINHSLFKESFLPIAVKFVGEEKAEGKVNEYLEQHFMSDYVEVLLPYFVDSLSLDDINFLSEYCNTPEGKLAAQHAAELNEKSYAEMEELGAGVMMSLMLGLPVDPVETVECPTSYRKTYNEYFEKMSCEKLLSNTLGALETVLTAEANKADEESARMLKNAMTGYADYMTKNYNELFLGCCYGVLTEDDMRFYINYATTPAGRKYNNCASKMAEDSAKLGVAIVTKFTLWVSKQ